MVLIASCSRYRQLCCVNGTLLLAVVTDKDRTGGLQGVARDTMAVWLCASRSHGRAAREPARRVMSSTIGELVLARALPL